MSKTIATEDKLNFISTLKPALKSGEYRINVKQQVTSKEGAFQQFTSQEYEVSKNILVASERFRIEPQNIFSLFPPRDNTGDHDNSLPQVVLKRATLPWERAACSDNESDMPWMMVVVVYEHEMGKGLAQLDLSQKVKDVVDFDGLGGGGKIRLPGEVGQDQDELVDVLKVKKSLVEKLIPAEPALELMTSVRKGADTEDGTFIQLATCFSNRLPIKGEKNFAYLISLENRFTGESGAASFDFGNGVEGDEVNLICLAHWSFSCPNDQEFERNAESMKKLENLDAIVLPSGVTVCNYCTERLEDDALYRGLDTFKNLLPDIFGSTAITTEVKQEIINCFKVPTRSFEGILEKVSKGNFETRIEGLNKQYQAFADPYIKRSASVLPHHLRNGKLTRTWYHGPLIAGFDTTEMKIDILPIRSSDTLYQYDKAINMLDVSYAAAWELGRLLMLNDKKMAMDLFSWKQENVSKLKEAEQNLVTGHLPFADPDFKPGKIGLELNTWFNDLNLLYRVPFNYLVCDEIFLPVESIRFFEVDNYWIDCLMDGAFSVGRVTNEDLRWDQHLRNIGLAPQPRYARISGLLLRSDVVSGWPSIEIQGYSKAQDDHSLDGIPTKQLRMDRIDPNLLICLFEGPIETVDIHLKAESLHMGFSPKDEKHAVMYKKLKDLTTGVEIDKSVDIIWQDDDVMSGVVDVIQQREAIEMALDLGQEKINSGQFSLEMITGVPRVRFNK